MENHISPLVGIIMGSTSDWDTMAPAAQVLSQFEVPFERNVVSAHRTPLWMVEYATSCRSRGIEIIIAGAGGAAHLPGMVASLTQIPVLGVPVKTSTLNGVDSLLSIIQMPKGVPVATLAIGSTGAHNAALLAVRILSLHQPKLADALQRYHSEMTSTVRATPLPPLD